MRHMRVTTEGIPLAPRVLAQQEVRRQAAMHMLANFKRAMGPFVRAPMPVETRDFLCVNLERIAGRAPAPRELDLATHLLVCEERAQQVVKLWEMPVLGSPEVRCDDLVVVAAYQGIEVGPLEGPGAERAQIRFRPLVRVLVRWGDCRHGAAIEGTEVFW